MTTAETVFSRQGDTVDLVLWRHRGRTAGLTEQVLASNPGLADHGPLLPAGVAIMIPATNPAPVRETVKLWD